VLVGLMGVLFLTMLWGARYCWTWRRVAVIAGLVWMLAGIVGGVLLLAAAGAVMVVLGGGSPQRRGPVTEQGDR